LEFGAYLLFGASYRLVGKIFGYTMIDKIISGGQTGVDQAALDVAIKLGIPYGGWIPKGRKTENGALPQKYNMQEMPTANYAQRTEKNVIDSNATLIISRGKLTNGSEYTRKMAMKHHRPWLHIDITKDAKFHAATRIVSWIFDNQISVLNVAGPRASKDPEIYVDAMNILESAYYLSMIEENTPSSHASSVHKSEMPYSPPRTAEEAVQKLISDMSLKTKTTIANMTEVELANLKESLGRYIIDKFGLLTNNHDLLQSCRFSSAEPDLDEHGTATFIIKKLWQELRNTHKLRVVK
jgi:hypothetical protein